MSKILICGNRNWTDEETIEDFIKTLSQDVVVIHGGCRGADMIADKMARKHGLTVDPPYFAKWELYGKAAGPKRNKQMIIEGRPDRVVAFHNNLSESKGTANMIKQAKEHGLPCDIRTNKPRVTAVETIAKPVEDGVAEKILNETLQSAFKKYNETIAPSKKAYNETEAQARMLCEETVELAYEVYRKSREPFKEYYDAKHASSLGMTIEEYREAMREVEE